MRITLKLKLVLAFIAVSSLVGLVGFMNLRAISSISSAFNSIVDKEVSRITLLGEIRLINANIREDTALYILDPADSDLKTELDSDLKRIAELNQQYLNSFDAADNSTSSLKEKADAITAALTEMTDATTNILGLNESTPAHLSGVEETELKVVQGNLSAALDVAIEEELAEVDRQDFVADGLAEQATRSTLIAAILSMILAIGIGFLISISLSRNLRSLQKGATYVANGDFNRRIELYGHDELGELAKTFNNMADRLKDSYQRIALEKQRDEALLESMGEGLLAVDHNSNIVLANSIAVNLLELPSREATVGASIYKAFQIHDIKTDTILPIEQRPSYITLQTGKSVSEVFAFHKKDGHKILLGVMANPVTLNGTTVGAIIILRDVTKEKEIDRMKTEFISLASHQLRTPLSAIRWFTEMLMSGDAGELNPEQKEFSTNIYESTERMIQLVNSLLNISRIESGRIIVDPRPTDLGELLNGIVTDLKGKTAEKQQSLIVSVHKDLPKINLDPRLISQVYLNFLTNANRRNKNDEEFAVVGC